MDKTNNLDIFMTDLADSIREATGETGSINAQSFSTRITGLGTGKQDKLVSGENIKTINGESILGSGNISISGGSSGGSGAYSEVNHGTSDTTFTLTPNTFHVWDEVANLTLTLGSETSGVANEFLFQFNSGSNATTLTMSDDIKWTEEFVIEPNMIYQVSILKGLASVLEFSNAQLILINFTIGDTQYQAEEGMTWNIWCNSQYNTDFVVDSGWIWEGNTNRYYIGVNGMPEAPSSIIIDGTSYELIDDW